MVINAFELKLFMVETVAQYVGTQLIRRFHPKIIGCK